MTSLPLCFPQMSLRGATRQRRDAAIAWADPRRSEAALVEADELQIPTILDTDSDDTAELSTFARNTVHVVSNRCPRSLEMLATLRRALQVAGAGAGAGEGRWDLDLRRRRFPRAAGGPGGVEVSAFGDGLEDREEEGGDAEGGRSRVVRTKRSKSQQQNGAEAGA